MESEHRGATSEARSAEVLTKAARRVCEVFQLSNETSISLLGIPVENDRDNRLLQAGSAHWVNAVSLVAVYEAMVAVLGGDSKEIVAWLYSPNHDLGCRPVDKILAGSPAELLEYFQGSMGRF